MENTTYIFHDGTTVKSYDDLGLRKNERTKISPPKPDKKPFRTAGTNGRRDYLRLMGAPLTYDARTLTDVFEFPKRQRVWEAKKSEVYAILNGRTCRIILDRDPWYFWEGEVSVDDVSDGQDVLRLKVSASVYPYKYERFSSVEPWLWDPFSFIDGVIREYEGIVVSGTKSFVIPCLDLPVMPGFWTSDSGMGVTFNGTSVSLTQRAASQDPKIYEQFAAILLPGGEQTLTLTGTGTVDINYRGGKL